MNEIYTAIYDRLNDYLTTPVGDYIPQDDVFPYVQINDLNLKNNDTCTEDGFSGTIDIISWSRYKGKKQVSTIMSEVFEALHHYDLDTKISVIFGVSAEYGVSTIHQAFSQIITEGDGLTRQGVQRFNIIFEKT